jgi:hypothetical protein
MQVFPCRVTYSLQELCIHGMHYSTISQTVTALICGLSEAYFGCDTHVRISRSACQAPVMKNTSLFSVTENDF